MPHRYIQDRVLAMGLEPAKMGSLLSGSSGSNLRTATAILHYYYYCDCARQDHWEPRKQD